MNSAAGNFQWGVDSPLELAAALLGLAAGLRWLGWPFGLLGILGGFLSCILAPALIIAAIPTFLVFAFCQNIIIFGIKVVSKL